MLVLVFAGLTGIVFSDCSDAAYSALRIYLALGFAIGFAMAELLTLKVNIGISLGIIGLAVLSNLIVEFTTQSKHSLFPCVFRRNKKVPLNTCEKHEPTNTELEHGLSGISESISQINTVEEVEGPQHTNNVLFQAYNGRRPSNWSVVSDSDSPVESALPSLHSEFESQRPLSPLHEEDETTAHASG